MNTLFGERLGAADVVLVEGVAAIDDDVAVGAAVAAIAPSPTTAATASAERSYTTVSCPARISRRAMFAPIRPIPMMPIFMVWLLYADHFIIRHPGLVPGSTVPRLMSMQLSRMGGCRNKSGMTGRD
jgi:hypothetical protein